MSILEKATNIRDLLDKLKENRKSLENMAERTKASSVAAEEAAKTTVATNGALGHWPRDVGIVAMEIYFPSLCVQQAELEAHDGVSAGKYTIGLGQQEMGFCGDREDINSLCLTVVQKLLERNHLDCKTIGRLEVGTETILDKSKSVKSVLMQLFESSGNVSIEGVDTTNACYGGTSALFNAVNWVESSSWDGRLAIVVAADIAVYAEGNARCTGGAGAMAFLIGPNAPLSFERRVKSTCMRHVYDFYKPDMTSEYPIVDGPLSVKSYLSSLDSCYEQFTTKLAKKLNRASPCSLSNIDYFVFHAPYCKLVQKSLARCMFVDYTTSRDFVKSRSGDESIVTKEHAVFEKFAGISLNESLEDPFMMREIEKVAVSASNDLFTSKTKPSLTIASRVGNMYTPSLYSCLASLLLSAPVDELAGRRIALFSYGSGSAASMFSLSVAPPGNTPATAALHRIIGSLGDVISRLDARHTVPPTEYVRRIELRKAAHRSPAGYQPHGDVAEMFPGTYYLVGVDEKFRRTYARVPCGEATEERMVNGGEG